MRKNVRTYKVCAAKKVRAAQKALRMINKMKRLIEQFVRILTLSPSLSVRAWKENDPGRPQNVLAAPEYVFSSLQNYEAVAENGIYCAIWYRAF